MGCMLDDQVILWVSRRYSVSFMTWLVIYLPFTVCLLSVYMCMYVLSLGADL